MLCMCLLALLFTVLYLISICFFYLYMLHHLFFTFIFFIFFYFSIYKAGGIQALFTGSIARVSWLLPFTTIYLGVYEMSKRRLLAYKKKRVLILRNKIDKKEL